MPPRRRPPASSSTAAAAPSKSGARPSKLAKEHKITAEEESEIREAFSLFAEPMAGEKEGIMPIGDVRRALIALNLPPSSPAQLSTFTTALDPDDEGFATYPAFVGICALQIHTRRHHQGEAEYEEEHRREVDEAYQLFTEVGRQNRREQRRRGMGGHDVDEEEEDDYTGGGGFEEDGDGEGEEVVITIADLRRVAALLRLDEKSRAEDAGGSGNTARGGGNAGFGGKMGKGGKDGELVVTEELLRDMILEANGGAGVGRGVRKAEFDEVMRRAGVWR